jgi:WD40 repeat protein
VRYEPGLQRLMCGRPGDNVVEVYATDTAQKLADLPSPFRKFVRAIHFDRAMVLAASADASIKMYDATARELLHSWADARDEVNGLAVSGAAMFAGSDDKLIYQYDLRTRSAVRRLAGHKAGIYAVQFDGRSGLLSGGADGMLCLWDLRRPSAPAATVQHPKTVKAFMFDSEHVVTACYDDVLRLYDTNTLLGPTPKPLWQRPVRETIHAVALCGAQRPVRCVCALTNRAGDVIFHGANQRLCVAARTDGSVRLVFFVLDRIELDWLF